MTKQTWNRYEDGPVPANWNGAVYPEQQQEEESWEEHMFNTRDLPNCPDDKVY